MLKFQKSDRITLADVGKCKPAGLIDFNINFEDRQELKMLEDMVLNLQIMLRSTINTISTLLCHYSKMVITDETGTTEDSAIVRFRELLDEATLCNAKAETLHKKVEGVSSLVGTCLILSPP
jgi:hypothetical protein